MRCDGDFLCFFGDVLGFCFCFSFLGGQFVLLCLFFCVGRSSSLFKIPLVQRGRSACLFVMFSRSNLPPRVPVFSFFCSTLFTSYTLFNLGSLFLGGIISTIRHMEQSIITQFRFRSRYYDLTIKTR